MASRFKSIMITGASSGIGQALACAYAAQGVTLSLIGRNPDRLQGVVQTCSSKGADVNSLPLDVSDRKGMQDAIEQIDAASPLDLVIANAGIARNHEDPEFSRELIQTNIVGVLNTIEPAVEAMSQRGGGQIALMSSLSAFRAFGGPPGYAASKAWIRLYGEAMRGRLARKGIGVTVICPGFVRTPMTASVEVDDRDVVSADDAANRIKRGIEDNVARISFPASMALGIWWSALQPASWTDRAIMRKWKGAGRPPA